MIGQAGCRKGVSEYLPRGLARGLYLALAFLLASAWRWDVAIVVYAVLFGGLYGYGRYQEGHSLKIVLLSALHAAAHMAVIAAIAWLGLWIK